MAMWNIIILLHISLWINKVCHCFLDIFVGRVLQILLHLLFDSAICFESGKVTLFPALMAQRLNREHLANNLCTVPYQIMAVL